MRAKLHPAAAVAAGVAATLAVATASIFVRNAQAAGMPSLVIAALRLGFSVLVLGLIIAIRRRPARPPLDAAARGLAVLAGVLLGLHFATWISSLEFTSVATSVVLVSTAPLWVAAASPFLLRERPGLRLHLGALLAIGGGAMVLAGDDATALRVARPDPVLGNLLAVAGAVAVAGYFMVGRHLRSRLPLLEYVATVYGVGALSLLCALPLFGHSVGGHAPRAYLDCFFLALFPQLIGHSTYNWVLRHVPASNASLLVLGEPVGAILLAIVLLDEVPLPLQLAGCALVLVGIAVGSRGPGTGPRADQ